ncbi:hypothetical protein [Alkaliphilus peptidifermentans]|uniref:Fluoroquinolone transport system permease protein n=1 Tax=Alkaliphilus peptidifermentans DSM 18978 TaxID=1120976 RepID=A0A1G5LCQ9_9FIRM|nr:hypothetical protein [Alkaliphilus peptidifermentans]SCZ10697.1 fluoroquinolone transport system permease protein [Alkaliphilus peptidifermentans DSM 18978]
MIISTSFKADLKTIVRDPILVMFFILPAFYPVLFKSLVSFLTPIVYEHFSLDLTDYYGYILSLSILMTPLMLGPVAGFLMIDERDSRIQELIKITPIGFKGYITNRLMLPFGASIFYSIAAYFIMNIYQVSLLPLLISSFLAGLQAVFIGYLLYNLAADKVQGLTYAKGFGIFSIIAVADIFDIRWFSTVAALTPFYWIPRLIVDFNLFTVIASLIVNIAYLLILFIATKRQ